MPSSISAGSGAAAFDAVEVALTHLDKSAAELGVTSADVADMLVTSRYRSAHNGVTHVNLTQRYQDLEVFGGSVTVNLTKNGQVLLASGSLVPNLGTAAGEVKLAPTEAVEAAAAGLELEAPADLEVIEADGGPAQETLVSGGGISDQPIPARLGWQPTAGGLRLAWELVIDDSSDVHLWKAVVDAETGALLAKDDWTSHDTLGGLASGLARSTSSGSAIAAFPGGVNDGSSYRVLDIPKETPNDGPHALVTNPAEPNASPFGWHDTNGAAGPEFTIPRGNNVHAYLDQDNNNGADFGEPNGGAGLDFDFEPDLAQHAQHYREAAATNLFYANNAFHDVMYGYGFTEAAGNFQANNYGRGGTQGDYVRAEAADGGGTNNANFSTPVETPTTAGTPRMQMYLWPGSGFQNQVVVDGVGTFNSSWSRFGGTPTAAGTSGQFVNANNGCTAADYAGAAGKIAVVTGGNAGCQNVDKARQAGGAGAIAVVMASGTAPAVLAYPANGANTAVPNIPVASITAADGTTIRNAIAAGTTTGTVRKNPDHRGIRDGDFENGIIIHEYTHGVSLRLTGGPAVNCLSGDEQGGEGWSDWYALVVTLDPDLDDPEQGRGMGPYALHQDDRHGAGIRPRRYSRNWEIQPFSYDSIRTGGWLGGASLAVPHGVGHGWAAVLWDLTWELVEKHGFNPNVYGAWNSGGNNRALQYVTDGLKMQGCAPGFVAARNGIIAATQALGGQDTCTVWAAFARRGLGYSAVQGTTGRNDNDEAYDTHPDCKSGFFGSIAPGPALNVKKPGTSVPMTFSTGGNDGLDILIANNPYSRLVDCGTLRTVDPTNPNITPRPAPVPALSNRAQKLSYDASTNRYTFVWRTLDEWQGTCREFVLTRKDGTQHRAYFRFDNAPTFAVSGRVRDAGGAPVPGAAVTLVGGSYSFSTTTDASGAYAFDAVVRGDYTATASAGGCNDPHTQSVSVSRNNVRLDFSLPERSDGFGYRCRLVAADFLEGDTALTVPGNGDDQNVNVTIPFPFTYYGQTSTQARICTNGWVEIAQTTGACSLTNGPIPSTGRPNGIYAFWDDLVVDAEASLRTATLGSAPNRRFVIEWRNVRFFNDLTRRIGLNVVLHENGEILTQYRDISDDGRERGNSATLGIENIAGTIGLMYSNNAAVLPAGEVTTIRYRAPQTFPVSGQVTHAGGAPASGVVVTLQRPLLTVTATTDAAGNYAFAGVPEGSYTASANAGLCRGALQAVNVTGPTTLNLTLGDQRDSFGYSCGVVDLAYEEANTVLPIEGDDLRVAGNVPLPFTFTLYGQAYTQARICTNGYVELGQSAGDCEFSNVALPATARPNSAIYPFWDDLFVDAAASIRADVFGAAPNRRFVIEWRNVHFFNDTTRRVDFNVVLHENGQIVTQYRNIAADGREQGNSATIGIENAAGTVALQFSANQATLGSVSSIRFTPPS